MGRSPQHDAWSVSWSTAGPAVSAFRRSLAGPGRRRIRPLGLRFESEEPIGVTAQQVDRRPTDASRRLKNGRRKRGGQPQGQRKAKGASSRDPSPGRPGPPATRSVGSGSWVRVVSGSSSPSQKPAVVGVALAGPVFSVAGHGPIRRDRRIRVPGPEVRPIFASRWKSVSSMGGGPWHRPARRSNAASRRTVGRAERPPFHGQAASRRASVGRPRAGRRLGSDRPARPAGPHRPPGRRSWLQPPRRGCPSSTGPRPDPPVPADQGPRDCEDFELDAREGQRAEAKMQTG